MTNQLTRSSWRVGSAVFSQSYTYNSSDGSINTVTMPDKYVLTMSYDSLRRLSTITGKYTDSQTGVVKDSPTNKRYLYRTFEDNTTTSQVTSLRYSELNQAFQYSYDTLGNIATYAAPGKAVVTYTYDKQGQLLSATGGSNAYSYTYDTVGNILTATKNGETHTYTYSTYDWKDKLIAYDGLAIAYDAIGNPTSYYNGTRWNMTWENGRELATATSGNTSLAFTYDGNGIRTSKTVNGVEHKYYYSGGKLLRETYGSNILDFAYNPDGSLYSFRYNQTYYYYVTNLQGDVIGLVDANGNTVASYEYDPYGDVISATGSLAETNPLRYRGYYYDSELGLYYLQSRYYDPTTGRFINADAFASTGQGVLGNNMFAYCGNNPVNHSDYSGCSPCYVFNEGLAADLGRELGEWLAEKIKRRKQEVEEMKREELIVSFTAESGGGGTILNSFMVTTWSEIYEYSCNLKTEYPESFKGSAEGIAVEWAVHNIACYIPFLSLERAKDVNLGSTIFEDDHPPMNILMWGIYYMTFPSQYQADLEVIIIEKMGG